MTPKEKSPSKRQHDRQTVVYEAKISFGGNIFDCQILNISAGGAKAKATQEFEQGGPVVMTLDPFGDFACDLSWNAGKTFGVKFKGDPATMGEVVMAIAVYGSVKQNLLEDEEK